MNLENFILFRKKVLDFEKTSFGFKGFFVVNDEADCELAKSLDDKIVREVSYKNNSTANHKNLNVGEQVIFSIDLAKFDTYYETFNDFVNSHRFSEIPQEFYIFEFDYNHNVSSINIKINKFEELQKLISFLRKLSSFEKELSGGLELFFHKPDKVCSINIDYNTKDIDSINIEKPLWRLENHVFENSDQETRKKLFTNEMINLLSSDGYKFKNVLSNWNKIETSYRKSFEIYLSEFSFEKIKTSSQDYFHKLTDKIYSTINKFSGYILAIPVAYVLIIRLFDFEGENLVKDTLLLVIGILYFIIIWFVLLNNIDRAFKTIEEEIERFLDRIKGNENLSEITKSLISQKKEIIPIQKGKICLVRFVSVIIIIMTIGAYIYIYWNEIKTHIIRLSTSYM